MSSPEKQSPFLKPAEIAAELSVDKSTVYKWIKSGELLAVQAGPTTKRVPRAAYAAFLGRRDGDTDSVRTFDPIGQSFQTDSVAELVARSGESLEVASEEFTRQTGRTPEAFAAAWRSGNIEDSAANARLAIRALALREARTEQLA